MRPYGERPTGNACNCCNVLRGGEDGHKRTAERMAAREDALKDLARHEMDLAEDRDQQEQGR